MRILKKVGIALMAFVLVVFIAATIAIWYLFTPEKLTPIVNKQAKDYLTCKVIIEKVEPTFFSSYPFFGIEINNLCLIANKSKTSSIDTLVYAKRCYASFDIKSYVFSSEIIFNPFSIEDGFLNFKINKDNKSNFDILKIESDETKQDEPFSFAKIDISNVGLKNINLSYVDDFSLRKADIKNINAELSLKYSEDTQDLNLDVHLNDMLFQTSDSLLIYANIKDCNLNISSSGKDKNLYKSDIKLSSEELTFAYMGDTILSKMKYESHMPLTINISDNRYNLENVLLRLNEYQVYLNGKVKLKDNNDIETDINYSTNTWDVEKLLSLVPKAYSAQLKDIKSKGYTQLSGTVKGLMSDNSIPVVNVNIDYQKGEIKYTGYPTVRNINMSVSTKMDMNKNMSSDVVINNAYAKVMHSTINVKGNIYNIMESPEYDIKANGNFNLEDFQNYIPKEQNLIVHGSSLADVHVKFNQSAIDKEEYHRISLDGVFIAKNFIASYNDTKNINMPSAMIKIKLPSHQKLDKNKLFANVKVEAPLFDIDLYPNMRAETKQLKLSVDINDMVEGVSSPITSCTYDVGSLSVKYDTLNVYANNTLGKFEFAPSFKGKQEVADINATFGSKGIVISSRDTILFDVKNISSKTNLCYNDSEKNIVNMWKPTVEMSFTDALFNLGEKLKGKIPNISFTLNPDVMEIKKGELVLGNSDFNLTGQLTDITKYINNEALLKGKFNLASKKTDVYELMDIFNGMGRQDSTIVENKPKVQSAPKKDSTEDNPFMVPKGIDIRLETEIAQTVVNGNVIENIRGGLTVKDGTLILDQMGFTSKAANMQLTAMYRSDRKNHLFSSIDFHLLNIDIEELINLIPYVDTMVPMLKSFKGRGEFHLAGETYLKSDYQLKVSTIRGAAAFEGQDLTVMDNETFSMISKKLLFEKKTKNVIDSLSAEITLFKDEIDIYPFLVVMDDYKAVISGRHNLDNSFNYHVSVTDCPLPVRLGLNISGTIDDLKYSLSECKYKHLYKPGKEGAIEKQTLRLKKLISNSLKENVKPIEKRGLK